MEQKLAAEIIAFWFSGRVKKLWFNSTPEFDRELYERYYATYLEALENKLDHWRESALGSLALVIILDQFPLNMFRNQARSFEAEKKAVEVANYAVNNQQDKKLPQEQKAFLYMPFMHSENLEEQDRSIKLFSDAGLEDNLKFAQHHRDIVYRFGRFPHRNAILQRDSTPAEIEYLQSKDAFHG